MDMQSIWENRQECSSHCDSCPGCEAPYPLMFGTQAAEVMLVGMEPAYNLDRDTVEMEMYWQEAMNHMQSDRKRAMNPLWEHLMNVAIATECSPEELYFTNLAKCNDDSDWEDRAEHCRHYLPREIAWVDPRVLLLYGSKVTSWVFEMFDLEFDTMGAVHCEPVEVSSLTLLPVYHWGYAYRQNNLHEYNAEVREAVANV